MHPGRSSYRWFSIYLAPKIILVQATKHALAAGVAAEQELMSFIEDVTHPLGVCHEVKSSRICCDQQRFRFQPAACPSAEALDPTEGPSRERRRLRPAPISFDSRCAKYGMTSRI